MNTNFLGFEKLGFLPLPLRQRLRSCCYSCSAMATTMALHHHRLLLPCRLYSSSSQFAALSYNHALQILASNPLRRQFKLLQGLYFGSSFSLPIRNNAVSAAVSRFSELPLTEMPKMDATLGLGPITLTEGQGSTFIAPNVDLNEAKNVRLLPGSNILVGPEISARIAQIKQAEFIKSSSHESECPKDGLPEFAVVGRSNVGKSSLVNALVHRKELAQTSKRPGKTQLINHYLINKTWYLVDLPGYGFAKAPTEIRTDWNKFTKSYFLRRKSLVAVLLLVDASIPPLQIDLDCASWLGQNQIPVSLVFTKCDKKKKKKNGGRKPEENVNDFQEQLKFSYKETPPYIMTSSVTNQGRDELLLHIAQLKSYWNS
ncbi:hypothetical protein O6H91_04G050300 [Diphasiastrum complanatum]|uniref:Uncharacterized protein n=1 Tax=Diphasiastrum complanatum TaxID=34168 RepID=A0ACC2DWH6_DIPCM|nr:hypothetical protein O6H91_04G050300 [Diphasiastrum complanatum]